MSLYNEMRPRTLNEVEGQDKIIKVLKENLASGNLPNAMLFIGTRGVGKTSIAKIVAKQVNCEHPLEDGSCCCECETCKSIADGMSHDVLELDAASNNGVNNIRDIIERCQFKPLAKMRVVILDEVHMLSTGAFNALLKIMEEPPGDVLFILCTTEAHKIPATIVSRCRKFTFEAISPECIVKKLSKICQLKNLMADESALYVVARAAKGSMRDAESIFENFIDEKGVITASLVRETLGFSNDEIVLNFLDGIARGDYSKSFDAVKMAVRGGTSLTFLLEECFRVLMDIISIRMGEDIGHMAYDDVAMQTVSDIAFSLDTNRLFEISNEIRKCYESKGSNMELSLEAMIISLACEQSTITSIMERLSQLESGVFAPRSVPEYVPTNVVNTCVENPIPTMEEPELNSVVIPGETVPGMEWFAGGATVAPSAIVPENAPVYAPTDVTNACVSNPSPVEESLEEEVVYSCVNEAGNGYAKSLVWDDVTAVATSLNDASVGAVSSEVEGICSTPVNVPLQDVSNSTEMSDEELAELGLTALPKKEDSSSQCQDVAAQPCEPSVPISFEGLARQFGF